MHKPKNEFWSMLYPEGMSSEDIDNELSDYADVLKSAPIVYCHATGGKISKLNTETNVVKSVIDDYTQLQIDEAIKEYIDGNS